MAQHFIDGPTFKDINTGLFYTNTSNGYIKLSIKIRFHSPVIYTRVKYAQCIALFDQTQQQKYLNEKQNGIHRNKRENLLV